MLTRPEVEAHARRLAAEQNLSSLREDHGLALVSDDPLAHVVAFTAAWLARVRYTPLVSTHSGVLARQLAIANPDLVLESKTSGSWRPFSNKADILEPAQPCHTNQIWCDVHDGSGWQIVLFSSGTSSEPKGIVHSKATLLDNIAAHTSLYDHKPGGTGIVAQNIQTTGFFTEVLKFLDHGRSLRLCPPQGQSWLTEAVRTSGADYLIGPISVMRLLFGGLRAGERLDIPSLVTYGEVMTGRDLSMIRAGMAIGSHLYHVYGLTEAPFIAGMRIPTDLPNRTDIVPIGQPLPGMTIENEWATDAPLSVEGARVALGYLGVDPSLAAISTSSKQAGLRRCITGDVLTHDDNGWLSYRGRADNQIKYAGQRYYLEELEVRVGPILAAAWGQIAYCLAAPPVIAGEPNHHLYLVIEGDPRVDADQILMACREIFNGIRHIVFQTELPRLRTNKPDRRSILSTFETANIPPSYTVATHPAIPDLLPIAAALIGRARLDATRNWAENGGDSLDALKLALLLEEDHGLRIDPLALTSDVAIKIVFDAVEILPHPSQD